MPIEATQPNALVAWVAEWGNIMFFFGQIIFWIAIAAAAIWAAVTFKRYVDFMTGVVKETGELLEGDSADTLDAESKSGVELDEFTE